MYLYAIVLKQLLRTQEAKEVLLQVLHVLPCFWSAWLELSRMSQEEDESRLVQALPQHWMRNLWYASACLEKFKTA